MFLDGVGKGVFRKFWVSFYLESSFGSVDRGHDWFVFFWELIFPPKFSVFVLDNVCDLGFENKFFKNFGIFSNFFQKKFFQFLLPEILFRPEKM